jgi:cell division protein FtsB
MPTNKASRLSRGSLATFPKADNLYHYRRAIDAENTATNKTSGSSRSRVADVADSSFDDKSYQPAYHRTIEQLISHGEDLCALVECVSGLHSVIYRYQNKCETLSRQLREARETVDRVKYSEECLHETDNARLTHLEQENSCLKQENFFLKEEVSRLCREMEELRQGMPAEAARANTNLKHGEDKNKVGIEQQMDDQTFVVHHSPKATENKNTIEDWGVDLEQASTLLTNDWDIVELGETPEATEAKRFSTVDKLSYRLPFHHRH